MNLNNKKVLNSICSIGGFIFSSLISSCTRLSKSATPFPYVGGYFTLVRAMFPRAVLFSLLSLVLIVSATGLECMIYVSSSDGINNTSCWTGGYQTPCATLDLALQGTLTVQDKYSSGTVINLSPGNYTLGTTTLLEQQLLRNNVSIVGMRNGSRYEEVNITCLHVSSSSYHWLGYIVFQCVRLCNCSHVPVSCTQPSFDLVAYDLMSQELCSNLTLEVRSINQPLQCGPFYIDLPSFSSCNCQYLQFNVYMTDNCNDETYNFKNDLYVCLYTKYSIYNGCYNVSIISDSHNIFYYELHNTCFNKNISDDPIEVLLHIQTHGFIKISANVTINVTGSTTYIYNGNCYDPRICDMTTLTHLLPFNKYCNSGNNIYIGHYCNKDNCYDNSTRQCLANCTSDTGVPINILTCVNCKDHYPLGILVFILIEIVPITLMVILIIMLNIQLANGSINGIVFYSQITAIIYFINNLNDQSYVIIQHFSILPCSIFNLDFIPFLYNYPLCIAPHMSPLGAISFWYVIGFYPLLLLLLICVWIVLYDKGFKCVVFITRPFHRCMARFWSMTGIEPSLTNSIASIYILSFTQLTATSFKILSFSIDDNDNKSNVSFFYDLKQGYFHGVHGLAGSFAILVLLIVILLPTLYIQFYPFKWFHKLLDCLHLRKQLLISLGDVFTGPYKNGSENTFDYRFMAGLYLLARIIILFTICFQYNILTVSLTQFCCSFLLAVIIFIFRAFQKSIHNFSEFLLLLITAGVGCMNMITSSNVIDNVEFVLNTFWFIIMLINGLIFVIIIPSYIIRKTLKAYRYCYKKYNPVTNKVQEDNEPIVDDDDWVADRMENPQEYNEQHVAVRLDDESEEHQPIDTTTAATYGSISETNV